MTNSDTNSESGKVKWGWLLLLGVVLIIGGVSAITAPLFSSLVIETLIGLAFVTGGFILLLKIFTTGKDWSARLVFLFLGLFNLAAGFLMLGRPLQGLIAGTLVVIISIFFGGLLRIYAGFIARPEPGTGWVIFGGMVSVATSIYLFFYYPEVSLVLMGIMAGISLISEGISYVMISLMGKKTWS